MVSNEIEIGRGKRARRVYTFDEIGIVPTRRTRDPELVSTAWSIDAFQFEIPVLGAPMDSVMSPATAIALGIGIHNFGEGLAIGSAFATGAAALGTFLVLGFTLHNITEGIGIVAVSMGGDGAFITDGRESLFAPVLDVDVRSTVGAGDSMVTGFLHGIALGEGLAGIFRRGVAAGTAAVTTEGTQLLTRKTYEEMLPRVEIREV